ncbi:MAG TPA: bifunctional hydroxymethylpyrimidine kinase/phosphomethylpyrimidine kinase [Candidatus Aquicultor sp.]|jgi:hydroxymethylpyrimidine kinase/phosphomethylpyrimidine kinase
MNTSAKKIKKVLAIGGSDPSGGGGIQADLKTLNELGVYPYTAITAVTAQNSTGLTTSGVLKAPVLRAQLDSVSADGPIQGVKTGMLGSPENVLEVLGFIKDNSIGFSIIDPVMRATDGNTLTSDAAIAVLKKWLLPHCFMVTPNLEEASKLTDIAVTTEDDMLPAAQVLKETGVQWVLIKGGHFGGDVAIDVLYDGETSYHFEAERLGGRNVRGTGCMLASAICAYLVLDYEPYDAVKQAKAYVHTKIKTAVALGKGSLQATHFCDNV